MKPDVDSLVADRRGRKNWPKNSFYFVALFIRDSTESLFIGFDLLKNHKLNQTEQQIKEGKRRKHPLSLPGGKRNACSVRLCRLAVRDVLAKLASQCAGKNAEPNFRSAG